MEAKGKHTPGPWVACAGDDCEVLKYEGKRGYFPHVHIGPNDHGRTYKSADGSTQDAQPNVICINTISGGQGASLEVHDANARLISKAYLIPEVREVLGLVIEKDLLQDGHVAASPVATRIRALLAALNEGE